MSVREIASYLQTLSCFEGLSLEEYTVLAAEAYQAHKPAGEVIVHEGDTLSHYFVLRQGSALVYFLKPSGKRFIVQNIGVDSLFATTVALAGNRYSGTIEIREDALLLCIPTGVTKKLLKENPLFAQKLLQRVIAYNLHLTDTIHGLIIDGRARLCRYLFRRALASSARFGDGVKFDLDMPKNNLAAFLDVSPETLSRMFSQLQEDKVIDIRGSTVIVHSIRDLVNISEGQDDWL